MPTRTLSRKKRLYTCLSFEKKIYCPLCLRECSKNSHDHHVLPASLGGNETKYNMLTICATCHSIIHNDPDNLLPYMRSISFMRSIYGILSFEYKDFLKKIMDDNLCMKFREEPYWWYEKSNKSWVYVDFVTGNKTVVSRLSAIRSFNKFIKEQYMREYRMSFDEKCVKILLDNFWETVEGNDPLTP